MYKNSIVVTVDGYEIELYTIGYVAKLLKRSVETLRAWERDRTIPKPMYRYKSKVRLYHPKEIEAMKGVLKKLGRSPKKEELKVAMWKAIAEVRREILNELQSEV